MRCWGAILCAQCICAVLKLEPRYDATCLLVSTAIVLSIALRCLHPVPPMDPAKIDHAAVRSVSSARPLVAQAPIPRRAQSECAAHWPLLDCGVNHLDSVDFDWESDF